jgi:hypothetical protein
VAGLKPALVKLHTIWYSAGMRKRIATIGQ